MRKRFDITVQVVVPPLPGAYSPHWHDRRELIVADSNGTEQAPHIIEYVKYVFGFLAAAFGYLWRRQVNRVDKLDEAIQKVKDTAISPQDLTAAMDSIRHGIDGITAELRHGTITERAASWRQ